MLLALVFGSGVPDDFVTRNNMRLKVLSKEHEHILRPLNVLTGVDHKHDIFLLHAA